MADETVRLIVEIENKADKEFKKLQKELKKLKKEANNANDEVEDLGDSLGKVDKNSINSTKSTKSLTSGFSGLKSSMIGVTAVASAVAFALASVVTSTLEAQKELNGLALEAGVSASEFENLLTIYEQFGLSGGEVANTFKDISEKINDAASSSSGEFFQLRKQLGFTLDDLQRLNKLSTAEQLEEVNEALLKLPKNVGNNFADQLAEGYLKVISVLRDNGEEVEKQKRLLEKFDIGISEEDSKKITKLAGQFDLLGANISTLTKETIASFSEEIEAVFAKFNEIVKSIRDYKRDDGGDGGFENIAETAGSTIGNIVQGAANVATQAMAIVEGMSAVLRGDMEEVDNQLNKISNTHLQNLNLLDQQVTQKERLRIAGEQIFNKDSESLRQEQRFLDIAEDHTISVEDKIKAYNELNKTFQKREIIQDIYNRLLKYQEIYEKSGQKEIDEKTKSILEQKKLLEDIKEIRISTDFSGDQLIEAFESAKKLMKTFGATDEERIQIKFLIDNEKTLSQAKNAITNLGLEVAKIIDVELSNGISLSANFPEIEFESGDKKHIADKIKEYFNETLDLASKELSANGFTKKFIDIISEFDQSLNEVNFEFISEEEIEKIKKVIAQYQILTEAQKTLNAQNAMARIDSQLASLRTEPVRDFNKELDLLSQKLEKAEEAGLKNTLVYSKIVKEITNLKDTVEKLEFKELKEFFELGNVSSGQFFEGAIKELDRLKNKFGETSIEVARFKKEMDNFKTSEKEEEIAKIDELIDLGVLEDSDKLTALQELSDMLPETSTEFLKVQNEIKDLTEAMDVFGRVSESVAQSFAESFAGAFTDALVGAEDLETGLKSALSDIIQQLLQAAIQAFILSTILSAFGIGAGATQSFSSLLSNNFASNLGVTTRHNGGSVGSSGDAGNSKKTIDLADPSRSLLPNERLIVAKTDESVVDTKSLNSPTGLGSTQPMQPQVNVNTYITENDVAAIMETDAGVDSIINVINRNQDKIKSR